MVEQPAGGYAGKILRVNLSVNTTSVEEIDEKFCRKYIGGAGFIALKNIVCCYYDGSITLQKAT